MPRCTLRTAASPRPQTGTFTPTRKGGAANMKRAFLFLFIFHTCTALAWSQAQVTTGVIQGTIVDPTGAAVPGARVEAKNLDTNFTRSQDSDAGGRFAFLQMPPGRYTVTASKPGFSTIVQENMELTVGQALSLPISMRVSGITEEVTVSAEPIEVTRVESSVTLNELTVSNTPVLGRKFEDLLTLTPGVSIVQGPDGDEINFAGQRGIFNNISLDGATTTMDSSANKSEASGLPWTSAWKP